MDQYSTMSKQLKMVERLLAHARMCREVADGCGNKELAADFNKLALECIQAAAVCKEQPSLRNDARLVLLEDPRPMSTLCRKRTSTKATRWLLSRTSKRA